MSASLEVVSASNADNRTLRNGSIATGTSFNGANAGGEVFSDSQFGSKGVGIGNLGTGFIHDIGFEALHFHDIFFFGGHHVIDLFDMQVGKALDFTESTIPFIFRNIAVLL